MAISSLSAAKRVCEQSEWTLSNLSVQKILYIAHMAYMGQHDGAPLVDEYFEAWDYGPVLPKVYRKAKAFGSGPVGNVFHGVSDISDPDIAEFIDSAVRQLAKFTPSRLVSITHWEKGAWASNYVKGALFNRIPNEDIIQEYKARMDGK